MNAKQPVGPDLVSMSKSKSKLSGLLGEKGLGVVRGFMQSNSEGPALESSKSVHWGTTVERNCPRLMSYRSVSPCNSRGEGGGLTPSAEEEGGDRGSPLGLLVAGGSHA